MELNQEQLLNIYGQLPRPVRAYLASTKIYQLSQDLGRAYSLHVDTIGILSSAITNMLLGLMNPAQFQTELTEMGVAGDTISKIVADLNEKVFKPLREEVRNALPEEPEEDSSESMGDSQRPETTMIYHSAEQPVTTQNAPSAPPSTAAPAARPMMPPPAVTLPGSAAPVPPPSVPTYIPPTALPIPQPVAQPLPAPPQASVLRTPSQMPPAPRPMMSPPPLRPLQTQAAPTQAPVTPTRPQAPEFPPPGSKREDLHNMLKAYGVDPYREQPE